MFKEYVNDYYVKNNSLKLWACCYGLHSGINSNISLENCNKDLKYQHLQGNKFMRMDKAIFAKVNLIRDKMHVLIIKKTKGKITSKLRLLRKVHIKSLAIELGHVWSVSENTWEVLSSTLTELYCVRKIKDCRTCNLKCVHCSTCIHEFSCTCFVNVIKNNMCKHIHVVCRTTFSVLNCDLGMNTKGEVSGEI